MDDRRYNDRPSRFDRVSDPRTPETKATDSDSATTPQAPPAETQHAAEEAASTPLAEIPPGVPHALGEPALHDLQGWQYPPIPRQYTRRVEPPFTEDGAAA